MEPDLNQQDRDRNAETHDLYNDPPANVLTSMRRKTCTRCFKTLIIRPDGTTYGSVSEYECLGRIS